DLELDLGLGDRGAEVVLRLDGGLGLLAQADRLLGRLDRDLELGLLVFLDAEAAAAVIDDLQAVDAQEHTLGKRNLADEAAVLVGLERLLVNLLAARSVDADEEFSTGEVGSIGL